MSTLATPLSPPPSSTAADPINLKLKLKGRKLFQTPPKKVKRTRKRQTPIKYWKLTTLGSSNFDPTRLTARQQLSLIKNGRSCYLIDANSNEDNAIIEQNLQKVLELQKPAPSSEIMKIVKSYPKLLKYARTQNRSLRLAVFLKEEISRRSKMPQLLDTDNTLWLSAIDE